MSLCSVKELPVPYEDWVVHRKCFRLALALYGVLNYWGSPSLGLLSQLPICFKKCLGVMAYPMVICHPAVTQWCLLMPASSTEEAREA